MERLVKVVLGDWAGDGNGITDAYILKISGSDVCDESLNAAVKNAEFSTGVKVNSLFSSWEDCSISENDFLVMLGFFGSSLLDFKDDTHIYKITDSSGDVLQDREFSVLALLMAFFSFGIEGFAYEVVEFPVIVGDYNAPVQTFGYGLFTG